MAVARRALRALRLNRLYPDWKGLADHADATGRPGWPAGEDWLRARVDQRLAPEMLERLEAQRGDATADARRAYFEGLMKARLVQDHASIGLVHARDGRVEVEWRLDRMDLPQARFVRWTLRVGGPASAFTVDGTQARATPELTRRIQLLSWHSALELALGLEQVPGIAVHEVCRGEIGPARPGPSGPWLSACLSRVAEHVRRVVVDDPLTNQLLVPSSDSGRGLSHQRKWAVPAPDADAARGWLEDQGSRNLVYAFEV